MVRLVLQILEQGPDFVPVGGRCFGLESVEGGEFYGQAVIHQLHTAIPRLIARNLPLDAIRLRIPLLLGHTELGLALLLDRLGARRARHARHRARAAIV